MSATILKVVARTVLAKFDASKLLETTRMHSFCLANEQKIGLTFQKVFLIIIMRFSLSHFHHPLNPPMIPIPPDALLRKHLQIFPLLTSRRKSLRWTLGAMFIRHCSVLIATASGMRDCWLKVYVASSPALNLVDENQLILSIGVELGIATVAGTTTRRR